MHGRPPDVLAEQSNKKFRYDFLIGHVNSHHYFSLILNDEFDKWMGASNLCEGHLHRQNSEGTATCNSTEG